MSDYQKIAIENVLPNDWNMNKVDGVNMEKLIKDIKRVGSNEDQPILVRKHPKEKDKYQIIDGEHRWTACTELGYPEVFVKITELDDKDAILKTISMNKLRGEMDTLRLAEIMHLLKETYGVTFEEIEDRLGYTEQELKGFEELLGFDFEQYNEHPPEVPEDEDSLFVKFELECTEEQKMSYEEAIQKCIDEVGIEGRAEALAVICKEFLTKD